ncbi:hypothetical protein GCM10010517_47580 [Streptosporangium fragile]|uniref:Pectate lyase n=2 Tax=Actinomycetes TaxID=1760 RepID=A0ABP6ILP1_9ACTN
MITFKKVLAGTAIAASALAPAAMSAQSASAGTMSDVAAASVQSFSASLTGVAHWDHWDHGWRHHGAKTKKKIVIKDSTIDNSVNVNGDVKRSKVTGGNVNIGNG